MVSFTVRCSRQGISILMKAARFDYDINVIWLKAHDPVGKQSLRIFDLQQSSKGRMICDKVKWGSSEVMVEVLDSPNNGKGFELGRTIISFSSGGASAGISNWVVLSINHLRENSSKSEGTGISVKDKLLAEIRSN